jgi:hypothetical protein
MAEDGKEKEKDDSVKYKEMAINVFTKLKPKLDKKEDICVVGYGQSGSGKTSTLIYLSYPNVNYDENEKNKPPGMKDPIKLYPRIEVEGIIPKMFTLPELSENISKITLSGANIYIKHKGNFKSMKDIGISDYYPKMFIENMDFKLTSLVGGTLVLWQYDDNASPSRFPKMNETRRYTLGQVINFLFEEPQNRELEPSTNNENSSRSHVVICLKLQWKSGEESKFIICDLAGVENKFKCTNFNEILKFESQYWKSKKFQKPEDPKKPQMRFKLDYLNCAQQDLRISESGRFESYNTALNEIELVNKILEIFTDSNPTLKLNDFDINNILDITIDNSRCIKEDSGDAFTFEQDAKTKKYIDSIQKDMKEATINPLAKPSEKPDGIQDINKIIENIRNKNLYFVLFHILKYKLKNTLYDDRTITRIRKRFEEINTPLLELKPNEEAVKKY